VPHRQRNNNLAEGAGKKGPLRHQGFLSRRPHLLRVGAAVSAPLTRTLVQYEATCHALAEFSPRRTSQRNAAADAVINYRKRIRDWPTLERAVDIKSREQQRFVSWWDKHVRRPGQGRNNPDRHYFSVAEAERNTGIKQPQVSKWRNRLQDIDRYRLVLYGAAYRVAMCEEPNYRSHGTGDEWHTPPEYIEVARAVLGVIELDPASSDRARETVKAERYFTREDDGLRQEWHGRVWLNPPYSQPSITNFVNKMLSDRAEGRVSAAIMMTNNCTDASWFQQAAQAADAVCFTRGRIKCRDASGAECGTPTQGQAFFYFGDDASGFIARFREKGVSMVSAQSRAGPDIEPLPWHHHKCAPADRVNGRRGRLEHHAGMRQRDVPNHPITCGQSSLLHNRRSEP